MDINVLVAGESSTTRTNIVGWLKETGIQNIQEADNGDQTVDTFSNDPINLVLVDWKMQTKSGADVVEEIRKLNNDVIIFATTAKAENVSTWEADQPGISDYLLIPFTAEDLKEKLDKFVVALTS